jgi:hypothetical protein
MKNIVTTIGMMVLILAAVAAVGQSSAPRSAPEMKQAEIWIGDWVFSGTAKDSPTGPEHTVEWRPHCHWVLGGFFLEWDSTWKGNGVELQFLEIAAYDPTKKVYSVSGFASNGSTWALTSTFDKETWVDTFANGCRNTFHFSADGMAASGIQECEQKGVRWTVWQVKGTKTKPATKK